MRNLFILGIAILFSACSKDEFDMSEFHKLYGNGTDDVGALIEEVSGLKIYFGHQSVGNNIIDGIEKWESETGTVLNKLEIEDIDGPSDTPFIHYRVGRNGEPESKIDEFVSKVKSIPEESGAVAFFKLCYVDITGSTDPEALFDYYQSEINQLRENRPDVHLVLFTVPLTSIQKGWKAAAKKVLKRQPSGVVENMKRHQFNELLRNEYGGVLPVFDLAEAESTLPDGSSETFTYDGHTYPSMSGIFTYDSGHLNDHGAKQVSYNLLAFLVQEI